MACGAPGSRSPIASDSSPASSSAPQAALLVRPHRPALALAVLPSALGWEDGGCRPEGT